MIATDAWAQANPPPFSPSLKIRLLRRRRLRLAAQSAPPAPAGACGAAGEFFNFSCNDSKKPPNRRCMTQELAHFGRVQIQIFFAIFFVFSEDQAARVVPDLEWGNADNPLT